ncbi:P-loop containing nucleoside triphosphate hydrolase protein [Westerdykella ornata]|uniref:P-loop containing nucleoside triphosphate hydrolase protein n=1 Tax=Westerdykella ornata TaxID=318751 RepID=A0A6A6JRG5_WESOR|nr:P-loop containing nucleoside triphosphate hydrolase protein [Westerdykella ornata]KAF2278987.1 P-loop containing nucleoside triphosphate hydrolase protein [Westerdykella ornata]
MRHLLPYLWLKNNRKFNACMGLRIAIVVAGRYLNVQIPKQVGKIVNHLTTGSHKIPWKSVVQWVCFNLLSSDFGLDGIENLASTYTAGASYQELAVFLFNFILNLGMRFHSKKNTGEIIKCLDQAQLLTQVVDLVLFQIFPVVGDLINTMVYIASDFGAHLMISLLCMVIIYVWLSVSLAVWINPKRRALAEAERATTSIATETISNYRIVSYFGKEAYERDQYTKAIKTNVDARYRCMFRVYIGKALQDIVVTAGYFLVAIFVLWHVVSDEKPVGDFVRFLMHWENIRKPLKIIKRSWDNITASITIAEKSVELLNTRPSVVETEHAEELSNGPGEVIFNDVTFEHIDGKHTLQGVSFVAKPGETIAIVGESGSGKSTIGDLLYRQYDVTAGSITIDGQDIRSVRPDSLREALGLVPQDCGLFNTSIFENVRYGRSGANKDEVKEACKAAAIHDKIMSLPGGYSFKVGEKGNLLSGGERQRIAIARLLLKDPKIVILDEPTSAVDAKTEAQVQEMFEHRFANRTTFVVAHRLSTIVRADKILVMSKDGRIIEQGKHEELLQNPEGKYTGLWSQQIS